MPKRSEDGARIAALVVTYNRKELLSQCLTAILAQDYQISDLIIIDNASTDGTDSFCHSFADNASSEHLNIEYHRLPSNSGGAGGFKEGLRIASQLNCDWVWLMDDDCIPKQDALSALVSASVQANQYGDAPSFFASSVFGPKDEAMNVPSVDHRIMANGYQDWYRPLRDCMVRIENATFVSLLISVDAIRTIGLPIGSFFIWGDDTEYTTRLTHYYGPAYLVGTSFVLHKRANASSLDIRREDQPSRLANFHYLYRNNLIVRRYHFGRSASRKMVLGNFLRAFKLAFSGKGPAKIRLLRAGAVLSGTLEYLFHRYEIEDLATCLQDLSKRVTPQ